MKYKLGYLILHYRVLEDTINCINSIKSVMKENSLQNSDCQKEYVIIVVDNGSGNGTGEELTKRYQKDEKVYIILSAENLGFAKGNNLGFVYAKRKLNCDFICMMNNDTELLQGDFFDRILAEYHFSNAAVIGPKIILNGGKFQPIYKKPVTVEQVEKDIQYMKKQLLYSKLHVRRILECFFRMKIKYFNKSANQKTVQNISDEWNTEKRHEKIVLHGSCLIFTPVYISRFDGLNDITFMFREEEFLYVRLLENNMLSVYNPDLIIRHYEDGATDSVYKKPEAKLRFQFENDIQSSEKLINEIERIQRKE